MRLEGRGSARHGHDRAEVAGRAVAATGVTRGDGAAFLRVARAHGYARARAPAQGHHHGAAIPLAPYEAFLGVPMQRGTRHRVTFAAADARRPFLTWNEPLWAAFEPELRLRLANLDAAVSTAKRVRSALLEGIPSGLVTMEAIARKLALSKRTLQRRIEAEDTSYQQILNETREALARHYLEKTTLPVTEISFLLGFDEPNSFYRAFRRWTGLSPDSVRRTQKRGNRVHGG